MAEFNIEFFFLKNLFQTVIKIVEKYENFFLVIAAPDMNFAKKVTKNF